MLTRPIIVAEARRWLGTPYAHQASLIGVGCDCLGLLRGVYEALIGPAESPPPYAPGWAETAADDPLLAAAARWLAPSPGPFRPANVLLFRYRPGAAAKHVAIASGPDRMIHAHEGAAVAETAIGPWWRRRIAAMFAFPNLVEDA